MQNDGKKLRKRKKIVGIIFLLLIILSICIASGIFLNNKISSFEYSYELLVDGTVTLVDYNGGWAVQTVTLPESIEGKVVSAVGDGLFEGNSLIKSVKFAPSIKVIGANAFEGCTQLVEVDFSNIEEIGESAFNYCENLKSIYIPPTVTRIGSSAFANCTSLELVDYNAKDCEDLSISANVFNNSGVDGNLICEIGQEVQRIPSYLFACANKTWDKSKEALYSELYDQYVASAIATAVFLGKEPTYMAFENWVLLNHASWGLVGSNLTAVDFSKAINCSCISAYAFYGSQIEMVEFRPALTKICVNAFGSCNDLKEVKFIDSLSSWIIFDGDRIVEETFVADAPSKTASYIVSQYSGYEWEYIK